MRTVAWLVVALCALSACSSSGEPTSGPTKSAVSSPGGDPSVTPLSIPTPTSSVTVRPAADAWPTDEAVRRYRAAMRPVNRQLGLLAAMEPSAPLAKARAALDSFARSSERAATSLEEGSWDDKTSGAVNVLIAALLDQARFLDGLTRASDLAAIRAASDQTGQTLLVTRTCAAALEKDLGIGDGLLDLAPSDPAPSGTP